MNEYNIVPSVHAEVISRMSLAEKNELISELSFLLQNNESRIKVLNEGGFRQLLRVLTGKDKQIRNQISLDTNASIKIVLDVLIALSTENDSLKLKQAHLQDQLTEIKKSDDLQSMYLIRLLNDMQDKGLTTADVEPLLTDWTEKRNKALEEAAAAEAEAALPDSGEPEALPLEEDEEFEPASDPTEYRKAASDRYIKELGENTFNSSELTDISDRIEATKLCFRGKIQGEIIGFVDFNAGKADFEGIIFSAEGVAYKKSLSKFFVRYDEIESIEMDMNLYINGYFQNGMERAVINEKVRIKPSVLKDMLEALRAV